MLTTAAGAPIGDETKEPSLLEDLEGAATEHMKIFHKLEMGAKNFGTGKNLKKTAKTVGMATHFVGGPLHIGGKHKSNPIKHVKDVGKAIGFNQGAKEAARAIKKTSRVAAYGGGFGGGLGGGLGSKAIKKTSKALAHGGGFGAGKGVKKLIKHI